MTLTVERLREVLRYDPATGLFYWLTTRHGCKAEELAGATNHRGYREIRLDGKLYRAHRLAFLYMLGRWPLDIVDHADGNGRNDAWANLRECTQFENLGNMKRPRHNKSGVKGVFWDAFRNKWHAQIQIDGRSKSLGRFLSKDDAATAYRRAAEQRFGDFARIE